MPRIRNISADELQRLFAAPELPQAPRMTIAEGVSLGQALAGREQKQREEELQIKQLEQKIAEEEARVANVETLAKQEGMQAAQLAEQQARAGIDPSQEGPEIGPLTPEAAATIPQAQQVAEAQVGLDPKAFIGATGEEEPELRGRDVQQYYVVAPSGERKLVNLVETAEGGAGKLFDALSGEEITQEQRGELASKGFRFSKATPQLKQDAAGNIFSVDPTIGKRTGEISAAATPILEEDMGTVTQVNHPLVPPKDRTKIIKEISDTKNDPIVRNALKLLPIADNVERFLKEDNRVAVDRLGGLTQKIIATDSGNLAAWEQRDPNSRDIIRQLKQWASMRARGLPIQATKEEMIQAMQIMRENVAENMNRVADITLDNLTELYPQLDREAFRKKLGIVKQAEKLQAAGTGTAITTLEQARAMSPEARQARIAELQRKAAGGP